MEMAKSILIGDAGGSSTSWRLIKADGVIEQFRTDGFNYSTHSLEAFVQELTQLDRQADEVHLYMAGADTEEQRSLIARELRVIWGNVAIENDLLGAARAVLGKHEGYACILGTGANASFYDGKNVEKVSASLGYLLGDEGSGAYIGKQFLREALRGNFEQGLMDQFHRYHSISVADTIKELHTHKKPNTYLASFCQFIGSHKDHPQVYHLIYKSFSDFFHAFFGEGGVKLPVNFVGSIAYHFSDILRQVGSDLGYSVHTILESPIAGLVLYHQDQS